MLETPSILEGAIEMDESPHPNQHLRWRACFKSQMQELNRTELELEQEDYDKLIRELSSEIGEPVAHFEFRAAQKRTRPRLICDSAEWKQLLAEWRTLRGKRHLQSLTNMLTMPSIETKNKWTKPARQLAKNMWLVSIVHNHHKIFTPGHIDHLAQLLQNPDPKCQRYAIAAVSNLSSSTNPNMLTKLLQAGSDASSVGHKLHDRCESDPATAPKLQSRHLPTNVLRMVAQCNDREAQLHAADVFAMWAHRTKTRGVLCDKSGLTAMLHLCNPGESC
jgi:hypothetical protein